MREISNLDRSARSHIICIDFHVVDILSVASLWVVYSDVVSNIKTNCIEFVDLFNKVTNKINK